MSPAPWPCYDSLIRNSPSHSYPHPFLPTTRDEMRARGWDELDVIMVSGDAYVDHPAFGPVLIARFLESKGLRVGFLAQPDWHSAEAFRSLGRPRLFFGISAGNLDSMLSQQTAERKRRSQDLYSPGGKVGLRPDRATIVYAQRAREAYGDVPIILGGIEASLRRIAHFDYWSDSVRRPILLDAKADLLVYGMGERPIWEITERLRGGAPLAALRDVRGTAFPLTAREADALFNVGGASSDIVELETFAEVAAPGPEGQTAFARMTKRVFDETNPAVARSLLQRLDRQGGRAIYLNPPAFPLEPPALDAIYQLPFNRAAHPSYSEPVPALETVRHSLAATRGCFGGCAFCSIAVHEGRTVQSRSVASLVSEASAMARQPEFHGTLTDVGGPTANMYAMGCQDPALAKQCRRHSCLYPKMCQHLNSDHAPIINLLSALTRVPDVRHVFIASGLRYDLALAGKHGREFIRELAHHYIGGQISLAPEHTVPQVLALMHKPGIEAFEQFCELFERESNAAGKEQYPVCYFISGHPGCRLEDMIELALYLKRRGLRPRQVQEFIPTPMSLATAMYYTGLDPQTMKPIYVARGLREKRMQKALLLYWDEKQRAQVGAALREAGRADLIGKRPGCLISSDKL